MRENDCCEKPLIVEDKRTGLWACMKCAASGFTGQARQKALPCPVCGSDLMIKEGCKKCSNETCDFSACSA